MWINPLTPPRAPSPASPHDRTTGPLVPPPHVAAPSPLRASSNSQTHPDAPSAPLADVAPSAEGIDLESGYRTRLPPSRRARNRFRAPLLPIQASFPSWS